TPELRRTRQTLRRAEFGFFGVTVYTRVHTPRRWGAPARPAVFVFFFFRFLPSRTSCSMVGIALLYGGRHTTVVGRSLSPCFAGSGKLHPTVLRDATGRRSR